MNAKSLRILSDILNADPSFRFYRAPKKLYEIFSSHKKVLDLLIKNSEGFLPSCPNDLPFDQKVVVEYGCNSGEMSLLYLEKYNIKKLVSIDNNLTAIKICQLIKETRTIENWHLAHQDIIKTTCLIQRDFTILHDPFTFDDFDLSESEYITSCNQMIKNALEHTNQGGGVLILEHGSDIYDYESASGCDIESKKSTGPSNKNMIFIRKR